MTSELQPIQIIVRTVKCTRKIDRTNDASEDGCRKIDFFIIIGFNVTSTVQMYVVISSDNEDWKYYRGYISFVMVRLEIVPRFLKKIAILRVRFFLYLLETKIRLVFLTVISVILPQKFNTTKTYIETNSKYCNSLYTSRCFTHTLGIIESASEATCIDAEIKISF